MERSKASQWDAQYWPSSPSHARSWPRLPGWTCGGWVVTMARSPRIVPLVVLLATPKGSMMSSARGLTTTSHAILGLLAIQPWSTYELTRQMDRSLGRFWPRAHSKLYEEP